MRIEALTAGDGDHDEPQHRPGRTAPRRGGYALGGALVRGRLAAAAGRAVVTGAEAERYGRERSAVVGGGVGAVRDRARRARAPRRRPPDRRRDRFLTEERRCTPRTAPTLQRRRGRSRRP